MGYKMLLETLSPKLLDGKGDVNKPLFIKHKLSLRGGCMRNGNNDTNVKMTC